MTDSVLLTEVRDRVLVITLNRPEARNAVDSELGVALADTMTRLDGDDDLAVGVLTGAGKGFSAGMDLKAFAAVGLPAGFDTFLRNGARKPLIAAIEGFALAGGLEIALVCDLIVAARGAKLGIPEAKVGLFAAGGAVLRLPGRVPYGVAMEMALTGDPILAETAHEHGLVARLTDPGETVEAAVELAARIAANAPLSTSISKALLREGRGLTEAEFWKHQVSYSDKIFASADALEGAVAFAERRAPKWTGR